MKNGWQPRKLHDVCEIIMGTSPPGDTYNTVGEGLPLINGPVEFSSGSFGRTARTKFTTAPNKLCKENELILCVRGSTTGKMNIAGSVACIGRGVAAIRAKEYQPWINYFIRSKRDDISVLSHHKLNNTNWLGQQVFSFCEIFDVSACWIGTFSKSEMLRICKI